MKKKARDNSNLTNKVLMACGFALLLLVSFFAGVKVGSVFTGKATSSDLYVVSKVSTPLSAKVYTCKDSACQIPVLLKSAQVPFTTSGLSSGTYKVAYYDSNGFNKGSKTFGIALGTSMRAEYDTAGIIIVNM